MDELTRNRVLGWLRARYKEGPINQAKTIRVYTSDGVKNGDSKEDEYVALDARRFHDWIHSNDPSGGGIVEYCLSLDWIQECSKPAFGHVSEFHGTSNCKRHVQLRLA